MSYLKKRLIIPTIVITGALAVGSIGAFPVKAHGNGLKQGSLAQKISQRFNVSPDKVEEVLDEMRAEREAMRLMRFEERLDGYISEGKLTTAQKDLLMDKREEMMAKKDEFLSLSFDERRAKMDEYRKSLDSWLSQNGITVPVFGEGHRGR